MRKLILSMHMSLDGYVAPADGGPPLGFSGDGGVFEKVVPELIAEADTLLLGRLVADELLGYWLGAEAQNPNLSGGELAYARWATAARKAVLSNTQEQLPWKDSELLLVKTDEDMVRAVRALKQQPGKNIVVHGGVRTVQDLARLNLIDEYRLTVHPVAVGDGKPLVKDLQGALKLTLMQVMALKGGAVFLRYQAPIAAAPTTKTA